ncbi:hypothetical protein [Mycolicibacterium houstonense]|nr:hypothetical protein [Mycolicibacterium houstonense]
MTKPAADWTLHEHGHPKALMDPERGCMVILESGAADHIPDLVCGGWVPR